MGKNYVCVCVVGGGGGEGDKMEKDEKPEEGGRRSFGDDVFCQVLHWFRV